MQATIYLVDDDEGVRSGLSALLGCHGYRVVAFESGAEFLRSYMPSPAPGCLLLDLKLPDLNGLAVQEELMAQSVELPIIFISAHATVPDSVRAMKTGAADFLQKPFPGPVLLERVGEVLKRHRVVSERHQMHVHARQRYDSLTAREQQVARLVVSGHTSKDIALLLHISPRTVDHHRTSILAKLQVESIAELAALMAAVDEWDAEQSR